MNKKQADDDKNVVDGEIVGEFEDNTLMNLPSVPEEEPDHEPQQSYPTPPSGIKVTSEIPDPDRRTFFRRLVLGGTAALALGGSAALLTARKRGQQVVVVPHGSNIQTGEYPDVPSLFERIAELEYELASVTSERDQLYSLLNEGDDAYSTLQAEIDNLKAENESLQEINDLWLVMDQVDIDSFLRAALVVVGNALGALMTVIEFLRAGVTEGQKIIGDFVSSLPGVEQAVRWLQGRVLRLSYDLDWLADQIEDVVEKSEPLVTKVSEFVLWVLGWLPFGAVDKGRAGLDAMETIINGLPDLIKGLNEDVLDPLADWFGNDEKKNIAGILLNPMVLNLVEPAQKTDTQAETFKTIYDEQLSDPVTQKLDQRASIRTQIQQAEARLMELRA